MRALRWAGPGEGVEMCALMHVLHAIVQGTNKSREMVVVLRMLLSLAHTQVQIEDHSLMYTQRIGICLCLTHA